MAAAVKQRDLRGMRSRKHVLHIVADKLEHNGRFDPHYNPEVAKAVRKMARDLDERGRLTPEDERRIDRQRTIFGALPSCNAADRLKAAMLQRAYDMLWDGNSEGCDALLEFLPSLDVEKMLDGWSNDQDDKRPYSKWYDPKEQP